jgi:hypothetical protein
MKWKGTGWNDSASDCSAAMRAGVGVLLLLERGTVECVCV